MSRRMRELLVGVAILLAAAAGGTYQAAASSEDGELPRLICPLH